MSPSKGIKRKWNLIDGQMSEHANTCYSLELSCSSTSSVNNWSSATALITISSSKETDKEPSMDLKSVFIFDLDYEKLGSPKKSASSSHNVELNPGVDPEFQFSTWPSKFDGTSICSRPNPLAFGIEMPIADTGTLGALNADKGSSTEVRLLPSQTNLFFYQVPRTCKPASIVPNLSSCVIKESKSSVANNSGIEQWQPRHQCISGSRLCQVEGCREEAIGAFGRCFSHGGRHRCQIWGCHESLIGQSLCCKAHGGGCQHEFLGGARKFSGQVSGVLASNAHNSTSFCVRNQPDKRCIISERSKKERGRMDCCFGYSVGKGGKTCEFEGCDKISEERIGFCQIHGGGKRCSWGHPESKYGVQPTGPCNFFVSTITGLCALHSGLVEDERVHGGVAHQWLTAE